MKTFFTSDLHLQSTESPGIIDWAKRPFKSIEKMECALIRGINERCKPGDLLIHVGDFMNYGKNRGKESGRHKPEFYTDQINCQVIFLEGNHDPNNHVRTIGRTLTTKVGRYVCSVGHYPSGTDGYEKVVLPQYTLHIHHDEETLREAEDLGFIDFGKLRVEIHLCGHVHNKWKHMLFEGYGGKRILNINVGTDVWGYRPVSEAELDGYIGKVLAGKVR